MRGECSVDGQFTSNAVEGSLGSGMHQLTLRVCPPTHARPNEPPLGRNVFVSRLSHNRQPSTVLPAGQWSPTLSLAGTQLTHSPSSLRMATTSTRAFHLVLGTHSASNGIPSYLSEPANHRRELTTASPTRCHKSTALCSTYTAFTLSLSLLTVSPHGSLRILHLS